MEDFFGSILIFFTILLIRYFAIAGVFYAYYLRFNTSTKDKKILSRRPAKTGQIRKEIYWSIISSGIFALFGAVTYWLWANNLTGIYLDPLKFGYWYLPISLVLVLLVHETYYYWLHRAMHIPKIYKVVHKVHHQSLSPTPWTAFSFHPWESVLEAFILPIILVVIPVNIYVLLIYLFFMSLSSVINHLDIEIYPVYFRNSAFGKLWIDATHHHFHHKEFNTNYGLYFTFWDKIMGTESRKME
ncbi:sterol desaturase/sphingolipid hydroxylase (fatty acid hydroxylase superfamily) [Gelidibacter algens]|jgi:sterol desaturase/sphingolipid hydroxylase (fatty acid hydroxylase superfamily)|uniref:Sterol desaturase/sphingolipid hydroxylase (Fatty acid hydroxylase superfamily) n=1 Tax=Gelidibacter algens TaxID=49280 RepID=A0A1A7R3D7_9FLAO|nr:sterol desaturase family protein [Gelidibacter algens]OBX26023.1 sterol desaturase [Gelidibacter algens]RAJ27710.1 sterol desaturase/sphingolipid hydroxylase (fatty acid hydroxylase superfamily) [Gelidibacter algens]